MHNHMQHHAHMHTPRPTPTHPRRPMHACTPPPRQSPRTQPVVLSLHCNVNVHSFIECSLLHMGNPFAYVLMHYSTLKMVLQNCSDVLRMTIAWEWIRNMDTEHHRNHCDVSLHVYMHALLGVESMFVGVICSSSLEHTHMCACMHSTSTYKCTFTSAPLWYVCLSIIECIHQC